MEEKCVKCDATHDEAALEDMPCCDALVCWDFCLYEEPTTCPGCGTDIEVVQKDPVTKESYVIPAWVRREST